MTSIEKSNVINSVKKSGFIGTLVTILTILFGVYGFYYKTTSVQEDQAKTIELVKKDVTTIKDKINATDVYQGVSTAEYQGLKEKVAGIEKTVDKIDNKLDRILEQTK